MRLLAAHPLEMASRGASAPLHFILRYSDTLRRVDTYAEHKSIADRYGSVWWGKFGVGAALHMIQRARDQIKSGLPTYVFLLAQRSLAYRGKVLDILGGGGRSSCRPRETARIPAYYRKEECSLWFKLADLRPLISAEKRRLVLYHSPFLRPQLTGMKGLIYVTIGYPDAELAEPLPLDDPSGFDARSLVHYATDSDADS